MKNWTIRRWKKQEKAAQGYVDGTMESDGFAYDGAAIYDLQETGIFPSSVTTRTKSAGTGRRGAEPLTVLEQEAPCFHRP